MDTAIQERLEQKTGSLYDLIPDVWKSKNAGLVLVRAFPIFGVTIEDQQAYFSELHRLRLPWPPMAVAPVWFGEHTELVFEAKAVADEDGDVQLLAVPYQFKLLRAPAFILMTTFDVAEQEESARRLLDQTAAWIGLNFGPHVVSHPIFEQQISFESKDVLKASNVVSVPGRFAAERPDPEMIDWMSQIADTLKSASEDVANRITRALLHCYKGIQEGDQTTSFLSYWTALEILCGGSKIRQKIHKQYRNCGLSPLDEKLGLARLVEMRKNIIHHGLLIETQSFHQVSRYLQYMIFDLIRGLLGVESHRAVDSRQKAGLDLRVLGLENYGARSQGTADPTVRYR